MKRKILVFLIVFALALLSVFVFIPASITVSGYSVISVPAAAVNRMLQRKEAISQWWPGSMAHDSGYRFAGIAYRFPGQSSMNLLIDAEVDGLYATGEMVAIPVHEDSSAIQFNYQPFASGNNPVTRISYYFKAIRLKKQLLSILDALQSFAAKTEHIYGVPIIQSHVTDSSLVSVKKLFAQYPSSKEITDMVAILRKHIAENGGIEKDHPMLNINPTIDSTYETMVAIPIARDIPVKGDIVIKKMVLGNILEARVTGGPASIANAEAALKNFAADYAKRSPAIPFQSMVNDRYLEKDSSKWVTYVKYPVF